MMIVLWAIGIIAHFYFSMVYVKIKRSILQGESA